MAGPEGSRNLIRGGALDALRFAAAAFITVYHFGKEEAPRALGEIHPALDRGFLATDFFMLLSGYILARTYGPRLTAGAMGASGFMVRRLARIWPAHLVVLSLFVLLVGAAAAAGLPFNNPQAFGWDALARQAVFAHAWGLGPEPGWNSATWTLSALVVCYALFPVMWRGLSALGPWTALGVALTTVALADLAARAVGMDLYALPPAIGVGRGLPLFLLGAAAARVGMAHQSGPALAWSLAVGGVGLLVLGQSQQGLGLLSMLGLTALIASAGAHAPRRPSRLAAGAAAISFALFMTHNLVGLIWFRALKLSPAPLPEAAAWAGWALAFPASLLAAWLFHRWVDRPVQAWLKPRLDRAMAARPRTGTALKSAV